MIVKGQNVEELMEWSIDCMGAVNTLAEEEAKVGGVLTMVKIGRDKAG